MSVHLRGSFVSIPHPQSYPISTNILHQDEFTNLQTVYPGMRVLFPSSVPLEEPVWFDHSHRVVSSTKGTWKSSQPLDFCIERNGPQGGVDVQDISGFRKVTHLVDPVLWIQGKYSYPNHPSLPWNEDRWELANTKMRDPMNQAYVEALAYYALGRLREADHSPHFHRFFGAFTGVAKTYTFNITDSYLSYRHCRWFWEGQKTERFALAVDEDVPDEVKEAIYQQPEDVYDSDDSDSDQTEELGDIPSIEKAETGSLQSANSDALRTASDVETEEDSEETDTDTDEELTIYTKLQNFPVMIMYMESSEGTMDDLLENPEEVGAQPGTKHWEHIWRAWIFQVVAALCVGQSVYGFTHNDLHSNNVVWTKTDKQFLYYTTRDGVSFQIPTFGKLFKLIDFGRAIFKLHERTFFSDDFREGNDAAEQYNFGDIYNSEEEEVHPNPSFDLARFTVSIFEALFPITPLPKRGGNLLSSEPGLKVKETESELYNTLWKWLLCDDDTNILHNPDGSDRYPDFDLYKVIAAQVHDAIPSEQVKKPVFEVFRVNKKKIPKDVKVYSLFC
jgi:hypothetical protein